jgi:ankyrin repeat protein
MKQEFREFIEKVIRREMDVNTTVNNRTALQCAAILGDIKYVEQLLAIPEIDVNKQDKRGKTAFMLAAFYYNFEVVKLLLQDKRVDVNINTNADEDVLFILAMKHNCIKGEDIRKYTEIIKLLLSDERIDVNRLDENDESAVLNYAARWAFDTFIKALLEDEALNINIQNSYGNTALFESYKSTTQLLLADERIDVNIRNKKGETPLIRQIDFELNGGELPVEKGGVYLLIADKRVNVNLQDNEGNTALHCAIHPKGDDIMKHLLERPDIDITILNNRGKSALDIINDLSGKHAVQYNKESKLQLFKDFQERKMVSEGGAKKGTSPFVSTEIRNFLGGRRVTRKHRHTKGKRNTKVKGSRR